MAVIQKIIRLGGSIGSKEELAFFDGGTSYSCILPELAKQLGLVTPVPEPMTFRMAENPRLVTATERVCLEFHLQGYRFSDEFMLVPHLPEQVIIGAKTLRKWRMRLDFDNDEVIIDIRVTKQRLMQLT
jgi:hypothetical protein